MRGLEITEETLALDWIQNIGTDQSHISSEHTLIHFREDNYPDLLDHRRFDDWYADGGTDLAVRASKKVDEILGRHESKGMDKSIRNTLQDIINK